MPTAAAREATLVQRCFHALGDETRLRLSSSSAPASSASATSPTPWRRVNPRLSFHLKVLKDAGLVTDRRDGRWVYYALDGAALEALVDFLSGLRPRRGRLRLAPRRCD